MKKIKEYKKVNMDLEVRNNRLVLHYSNSGERICGEMDVTQLFHFFKDFFKSNSKKIK